MIKPTVGRVVWFWPSAATGPAGTFCHHDRKQPCAALIAHVWGDTCVNLHVIDQNGVGHNFTSVPLHQEGEPRPDGYFCEWMPYQIGQAKRHEGAAPPPKPAVAGVVSDQTIEQEIQAKGLTAARVTPERIEEVISGEAYFTAAQALAGDQAEETFRPDSPFRLLTFCVLVLKNGFTVTGESACASPENFNAELGRKIARANAIQKIWPLEGYLLRQRLSEQSSH